LPMKSREKQDKMCSKKCIYEYYSGENAFRWEGGISFEPYSPEFNKKLKRYIRKRDNYTCQECKSIEGKLDVRHMDYNKKNSNPDNLILLCTSCHMKTNANRNFWKEYFKNKLFKEEA